MSLLLDQRLVGEVAEYCPAQFMNYYTCLSKGDVSLCFDEQRALSSCVKTSAPSFIKIIANCQSQMDAYESCIKANPEFKTQCFDKLTEMRECTSRVLS